jgi:hypothetical protein
LLVATEKEELKLSNCSIVEEEVTGTDVGKDGIGTLSRPGIEVWSILLEDELIVVREEDEHH